MSAAERPSAQSLIDDSVRAAHVDPELSRRAAEAALDSLRRDPDADLEIMARLQLCDYYAERDEDAANAQMAAANVLLPQAHRAGLRAGILNCQGATLETVGRTEQALDVYGRAVAAATETHDDSMLAQALLSHGFMLGLRGDFAQSLVDLRRSQTLYEQQKDPLDAASALMGIAIVYTRMGDDAEAQSLYKRALIAQRNAGLKQEEAATLSNLGRTHENLQQWAAAHDAYAGSLEIGQQINDARTQAYALRGLAAVALDQGNAGSALTTVDRADALLQQVPDQRLHAQLLLVRGRALHAQMRLKESLSVLGQALAIFRLADSTGELAATFDEMADVSSELGDWRDAYDYRTLAQTKATQLLRNQLDQRFASLKVEFDTETQQKANAALMSENRANARALAQQVRARNLQTALIALSVILVGVLALLAVRQRRHNQRMSALAMTDELTDLPNRRALLARLGQLLHRSPSPTAILIIDIDHFKSVNDRFGHLVGDETLKMVTAGLRELLIEPTVFGRLGGEEFAALLPGTDLKSALTIAETLRERVMRIDLSRWLGERRITVSIGVATSMPQRDTTSSMLRRADSALYCAKDAGRNCVRTDEVPRSGQITPRVA